MVRITVGFIVRSKPHYLETFMQSMRTQSFQDFELICKDNTNGKNEELITQNYPEITYVKGEDKGFWETHNELFTKSDSEFYLCSNASIYYESMFLEELLQAIEKTGKNGEKFAFACGKLYRWDYATYKETGDLEKSKTQDIDTLGHALKKDGRVIDMDQGKPDSKKNDHDAEVFGASGCAVMYRRRDIEAATKGEYLFDPNIFMYKEDVELDWRLNAFGKACVYAHKAIGYYDRTASNYQGQGYVQVALNRLSRNKSNNNTILSVLHQEYILHKYVYTNSDFSVYMNFRVSLMPFLTKLFVWVFEPHTKTALQEKLPPLLDKVVPPIWNISARRIEERARFPRMALKEWEHGNKVVISLISRLNKESVYNMLTQSCLPALLASKTRKHMDIIITKNSPEESIYFTKLEKWIEDQEMWHTIRLIENKNVVVKNGLTSYSQAHNYGHKQVPRADYRMNINGDVVVSKDTVQNLVNAMNEKREVGIMAPKMLDKNGKILDAPRNFPSFLGQVANKVQWVRKLVPFAQRKYVQVSLGLDKSQQVDWVSGHIFIMRGEVWDQIRGFDQTYFMYMTDVQMSKDAWRLGYSTWYNANIQVQLTWDGSSQGQRVLDYFQKPKLRQHVIDAIRYYFKN